MSDPAQSALFPAGSMTELYAISVNGGRPRQVLATPAEEICFFKSGDAFLYQDKKGGRMNGVNIIPLLSHVIFIAMI